MECVQRRDCDFGGLVTGKDFDQRLMHQPIVLRSFAITAPEHIAGGREFDLQKTWGCTPGYRIPCLRHSLTQLQNSRVG
jgi:hypothetical protein